jgi:uncharacterized protein
MNHQIDSEDLPTNLSNNEHFQSVVDRAVNRRGFLFKSGVGAAAVAFMSAGLTGCGGGGDDAVTPNPTPGTQPLLGFQAIATYTDDGVIVAPGYTATSILPWGTPLFSTGPGSTWAGDASENAAAQARQIGDNHDGIHYFAIDGKSDEGLLVMNHEYTNERYLFTDSQVNSLDDANKDLNAHGVSVVHIKRTAGVWDLVMGSGYNRRITGNTPMLLTGPAAGDALLATSADPTGTSVLGTLNNCGNGWTPWGTYLTCEENFNQYFGTTDTASPGQLRTTEQVRYGLDADATSRQWESYIDRFDWQKEPNESNRFGWIVEIDPFDPTSTPKKRTALGRFKHENAAYAFTADGRVVVYMGDDQANDYIYKFVSTGQYVAGNIVNNRNLLDSGTLYVAKFNDGAATGDMMGVGEWMELSTSNPALAAFTSAQILVHTRLAADALGATKMDRPEWVTVHPETNEVYATLTNNSGRVVTDDANPRTANRYGQIIRWREAGGDAAALSFEWDLFVLAGNPTIAQANPLNNGSSNVSDANTFNSPDGLGFDSAGRLWIQTDGNYSNVGNFANQGNNQMLCADPTTKEIRRFFVGPKECEVTGLTFTPDSKTMFINIQHPGEDGNSHWPEGGAALPRSATIIITKDDGGVIGT